MALISFFAKPWTALPVLALVMFPPAAIPAAVLDIDNNSDGAILNILVHPVKKPDFFWRLDLAPNASEQVENPGGVASLRIDTGLKFISFKNVNLGNARKISLNGPDGAALAVAGPEKSIEIQGEIKNLVPADGEKILCELDSFHPRMPMKDVCAKVPENAPQDDNGAVITGLSFAGKAWAARLIPSRDGPVSGRSALDHLELRRPLTPGEPVEILNFLEAKGYAPWQAEFPGINMDFADMANQDADMRKKLLRDAIERFMAVADRTPQDNSADTEPEASILLAPGKSLPALADADAPSTDVQIFTLMIRPATKLMLVDVAAYQGGDSEKD